MANITGTLLDDFLNGTSTADLILALAGNDTVIGFEGNDFISGNQNNDVLYGSPGNDTIRGGMDNDSIFGGKDNDELYGDMGNDSVYGNIGADLLYGVDGNDFLSGNQGIDSLFGGRGNDTLRGGKANDFLRGGKDNDEIQGDLGDDSLYGDLDNDSLFGNDGVDFLSGNQGNDFVSGNMGNDSLYGGQGNDTLRGGMQNDFLQGNKGLDSIYGDLGDDTLFGGLDPDVLFGDQGEEKNFGGTGNDFLYGSKGDDTLYGLGGNDFLSGNQGDDFINGNMNSDLIFGGQGNDTIRGGMQKDILFGDKGRDVLFGDLGADTLTGDVKGEVFSDIFVLGRVAGISGATTKTTGGPTRADADLITDFQPCTDFISLTGGLSYDNLRIFQGLGPDSNNTIIQDNLTNEILAVLENFDRTEIDGASFLPNGPVDVRIRAIDPSATEPAVGDTALDTGEFEVFIPCPAETNLLVQYRVVPTAKAATSGVDFSPISGIVLIPQGSNRATIPILPLLDTVVGELDETVTVELIDRPEYNTPVSADLLIPGNVATVTIAPGSDIPPTPPKPIVLVQAIDAEAGANGGTGIFQFARTGGDLTQPLTIRYTVGGSAIPTTEYQPLAPGVIGEITIPAGDSVSAPVTVTPANVTSDKTVVVKITAAPEYIIGSQSSDVVTIRAANPPTNIIFVDDSNTTGVENGTAANPFNTIQEGINKATDGGFVRVLAGTYSERILINKNITLQGPGSGSSPSGGSSLSKDAQAIIKAGGPEQIPQFGTPVLVDEAVNNVTIEGFTIISPGSNPNDNAIIYNVSNPIDNTPGNIIIRQNDIQGGGGLSSGTVFVAGNLQTVTIVDNFIHDLTATDVSGIQVNSTASGTRLRIADNVIFNTKFGGILMDNITGDSQIINNSVSLTPASGIQLSGGGSANFFIANNDITNTVTAGTSGTTRGGIRLQDSGFTATKLGQVRVTGNVIVSSFNAISIDNGVTVPDTVQIDSNNLVGSPNAALFHGGTGTLNAKGNWWDSPTGPVVGTTGRNGILGAGAGDVDFSDFSATPF